MTQGWNFAPLYNALDGIQRQQNVEAQRDMQYERMEEDDYRYNQQQKRLAEQAKRAQQNQNAMLAHRNRVFEADQAHRKFLREQAGRVSPVDQARINLLNAKRDNLTATPTVAPESYGLDRNGNVIGPGLIPASDPNPSSRYLSDTNPRAPQGRLQQIGSVMSGKVGQQSPQVPGLVTSPKSGRSDKFATNYREGNKAIMMATPEQRNRLQQHMLIQKQWTRANGRPPKSGHVYTADGRQVPSTSLTAGEAQRRSQDAILGNQIKKIDGAVKVLLGSTNLGRSFARTMDDSAAGRVWNSFSGGEKTAQAYADYEQGVLSAVYAMSGKQTTNAEMERFLRAYMPAAGDGASRIRLKAKRIKDMLRSIQGSMAGGSSFDDAQRKALGNGGRTVIKDRFSKYGVE